MTYQHVTVKKNERGVLLRNGDFERILRPGNHRLFSLADKLELKLFGIGQAAFTDPLADYLMAREPEVVETEFVRVELTETQIGLLSENDVLVEVLAPATRRLYWSGLVDVKVEVLDIAESAEVPPGVAVRLAQTQLRQRPVNGLAGVLQVLVPEYGADVLIIDGRVDRVLTPGSYTFWKFNRNVFVEAVDLRLQTTEVTGQEIMTRDKVGVRVNLSATWRCTDARAAFTQLQKPVDMLYRELQLGLRAAVGTRTLDELLENKTVIDEVVMAHVRSRLPGYGLELESVGVKDIVLPGEMKTILAQVVEAEKSSQANGIRRREETSATRSLLNTAKVMEGNPIALRMKELEVLERGAARIDKISVFGGLDQVLDGLVKLR